MDDILEKKTASATRSIRPTSILAHSQLNEFILQGHLSKQCGDNYYIEILKCKVKFNSTETEFKSKHPYNCVTSLVEDWHNFFGLLFTDGWPKMLLLKVVVLWNLLWSVTKNILYVPNLLHFNYTSIKYSNSQKKHVTILFHEYKYNTLGLSLQIL